MVFSVVTTALYVFFSSLYRALDDRIVYNFMVVVRSFEVAIFVGAAIVFLLMAVAILLRKAKRLPPAYELKVTDLDGNQVRVDGLRNRFSTYDAAESYARFYTASYAGQYHFKVVGLSRKVSAASHAAD